MRRLVILPLVLMVALAACAAPSAAPASTPAPESSLSAPLKPTATPSPTPTVSPYLEDNWEWRPARQNSIPEELIVYDYPSGGEWRRKSPVTLTDADFPAPNDSPIFTQDDTIAGGLYYAMGLEDAVELLGLPEIAYHCLYDIVSIESLYLCYPNGDSYGFHLGRNGYFTLNSMHIVSDTPGPRGICVGDSMKSALAAFRVDANASQDGRMDANERSLYSAHVLHGDFIPPCADIQAFMYDGETQPHYEVNYQFPGYNYTRMQFETGAAELPFIERHTLTIYIEEGRVTSYGWWYGAYAE